MIIQTPAQLERSLHALAYLRAIAEARVDRFVENGPGLSMRLHEAHDQAVPVIVSDGQPGKASFLSPRAHYIGYPVHEIERSSRVPARLVRAGFAPLDALLSWGRIDNVAYVNHWLLVGGAALQLPARAVSALVPALVETYPEHVLVFSGIVPALGAPARALVDAGGRPIRSRIVYLIDGRQPLADLKHKRLRRNRAAERRLYRRHESRRVTDRSALRRLVRRMHDLYSQLYLERHPRHLNPQYTPAFFDLLVASELFEIAAWFREGENDIDAFNIQLTDGGAVVWSVCGVNLAAPRSTGLFRLVVADDIALAERRGLVLNCGAGNGRFKHLRGGRPTLEYDVVFDRHLPRRRRLPWQALRSLRALTVPHALRDELLR